MIKYIALVLIGAVLTITGFCQENVFIDNKLYPAHNSRKPILNQAPSAFNKGTEKQKLDSIIEYNFNETTGEWDVKFRKESFAYDNAFNDTLFLLSTWDKENSQWVNLWKEITKYDEQNNISGYTAYTWGTNQIWEPFYKEQYTYNDKNELTETLFFTWKYAQKKWLQIEKTVHNYNLEGNLLTDTIYYKYNDSEEWMLAKKTEYEYTNGYLESINSFVWDTDSSKWFPDVKKQMFYDDEKWYLYSTKEYNWDKVVKDWKLTEANTFGHDENNNMKTNTKITWGNDTTVLMENFDFDYSINNIVLLIPTVLDENDRMAFHHKIVSKQLKKYNKETNGREKYREVKFYYSPVEIQSNINFSELELITVFPNPANECIQFKLPDNYNMATLELFNQNGQKVKSQSITNGERIDVASLKNGIYFYSIFIVQERISGKLLKNK